jgi:type I restriction enzyme M protein
MLGQIYTKSQNKIQDPSKLLKVIDLIDKENWNMMGSDIKGKIYEGLLEKNAVDSSGSSGAGQYFTPRALIKTIVACIQPKPMKTIADPACGSGGFFLAAYDWIVSNNEFLDPDEKEFLKIFSLKRTKLFCLQYILFQSNCLLGPNLSKDHV